MCGGRDWKKRSGWVGWVQGAWAKRGRRATQTTGVDELIGMIKEAAITPSTAIVLSLMDRLAGSCLVLQFYQVFHMKFVDIDLLVPSVPGQEKGPGFECNAGKTRRARGTEREHKGPILVLRLQSSAGCPSVPQWGPCAGPSPAL